MQIREGTRALVTGASRGIGRALVGALAARGATIGLASRSQRELADLAAELPGNHHVLPCDVGDREAAAAAIDRFMALAGGIDLLVANAGIAHYAPFATQNLDAVEHMTRVNWLGTVYPVRFALPHMLAAESGHIVVVSSGAGLRSFPGAAVYGATKSAQRGFAEALRHELHDTGLSLTTVFPGEIASSLHDHEKATMPEWYRGGPNAAPAEKLAERVLRAVERDQRAVYYPPLVHVLGLLHGVSPRLSDTLLRRLRGPTAAPRRG